MTTPSQNDIPSTLPDDFRFNVEKVDEEVNSTQLYYTDRFGVRRLTNEGRNKIYNDKLLSMGWSRMGDFEAGILIENRSQIVFWNGSWYQFVGTLPHTTTTDDPNTDGGIFSESNPNGLWVDLGPDVTLRADLASDVITKGDNLVAVKQPFNASKLIWQHDFNARIIHVDDYEGTFGDGVSDDTQGFVNAINAAAGIDGNKTLKLTPGKTYVLPSGVDAHLDNFCLSGYGAKIKYGPTAFNYLHCFRFTGDKLTIEGFSVECDDSLVRDDTGFGILIDDSSNVLIRDVDLRSIASAGVWCRNSNHLLINNVNNYNNKADGIHMADGVKKFIISNCRAEGCHDDSFAVVSDIPSDGIFPSEGLLSNNSVYNSLGGHGFVAIGCYNVVWDANTATGCAGPGFGSYFWGNPAGIPDDENWVRYCTFSNNNIISCGLNPVNESNATSFFVGALKNCIIKGNTIYGAPAFPAAGTSANCLLLSNALNLTIYGNNFSNSSEYGIYTRDGNQSGAATFAGIWIVNNTFNNIVYDSVHIYPSATIGQVSMINNTLINSPLSPNFARSSVIGKTGSALLVIAGNKNIQHNFPFTYDAATSFNISAYSNKPSNKIIYQPSLGGQGGNPGGTITATYTREDDLIYMDVNMTITALNGATNPSFSLPFPASGTAMVVGRIDSVGGQMLQGIMDNQSTIRLVKYDNTATLSGLTGTITISARVIYLASS